MKLLLLLHFLLNFHISQNKRTRISKTTVFHVVSLFSSSFLQLHIIFKRNIQNFHTRYSFAKFIISDYIFLFFMENIFKLKVDTSITGISHTYFWNRGIFFTIVWAIFIINYLEGRVFSDSVDSVMISLYNFHKYSHISFFFLFQIANTTTTKKV